MMIKAELPAGLGGKLIVAVAGQQGRPGCQPRGGNSGYLSFVPEDTAGTEVCEENGIYGIRKNGTDLCTAASGSFLYAVGDAMLFEKGPDAFLHGQESRYPMLAARQADCEESVYFLLTTEPADNPWLSDFALKAEALFGDGIAYYREIAETIQVETPEPCLDSAIAAQMVALDASWDAPVVCHGPIAWHNGQSGWRGMYGFVTAGWNERVRENVRQYRKTQQENGRIENYPTGDQRYNMGEVLVDELLQYWLWSGDNEFFEQGAYDFVAGHLRFQDACIRVQGTNLYENWLDAWNTDNKWNNGGPGSIATAYTWHACAIMASLAKALGKEEDALYYADKAEDIKREMKETLWCPAKGVYAEYKDIFGYARLHDAPDLSSIYTPIDLGITDEMEAYQMLRYSDYAIDSIEKDGCEFKYSSNWLPLFYSSCGLFAEEVLNHALAWFRAGWREKGLRQYMACVIPLVNGRGAGPGACAHTMNDRLENTGHIDFADTAAQYSRTAVEGIFGIAMMRPFGKVRIMPGFSPEWKNASIRTSYISYSFRLQGETEEYDVQIPVPLRIEMRVPARSAKVLSVTVNGEKVSYRVNRFVCFETEPLTEAAVQIVYGATPPAGVEGAQTAQTGAAYRLHGDGVVLRLLDPQGIIAEMPKLPCAEPELVLGNKRGHHTFFAEVKKEDMTAILPVDVLIVDSAEEREQTGALGEVLHEREVCYHTVSLEEYTNQNLRTLHAGSYDLTWQGDGHFTLPNFYFVSDTPRTVTSTGRSWWEDQGRGKNGVPEYLDLPERGGIYETDRGIPFLLSSWEAGKKNAVFVSLYNQFPDRIYLPVQAYGEKVYFMVCASTNSMQSRIENARLIVHLEDGTREELPLVNPEQIDDWLCYQESHDGNWEKGARAYSYAQNGFSQFFGEKAHANILAVDLHENRHVEGIEMICFSNEVMVGLLGVTVAERLEA